MVENHTILDPVRIGYYDPFNVYPSFKDKLSEKFPLTNLHWKQRGVSLKSIPTLPIEFVEEVPKRTSLKEDNTYLRIIFVCADTLEVYRSQVRPLIREWMRCSVLNINVEWLIIYFIPSNSKDKNSTIIKTSVFDKLKIDFGNSGKELLEMGIDDNQWDRCFKLREKYDDKNFQSVAYNDISFQIKELLISSFDTRFEELNSKLTSNNNIGTHGFLNKLDLANLLIDMRLLKEALTTYNELSDYLKDLLSEDITRFDLNSITNVDDFNNYKLLSPISIPQIKNIFLQQNTVKINLYELILFIFNKKSIILQALAYSANTVSISSIYICDLYRKLIYFLNDISTYLNVNVDELSYVLIEVYSRLPILEKIADDYQKINAEEEQGNSLRDILEYQGELKLFQRSKLVKIAKAMGYYINGINEILEDIPLEEVKTNTKLERVLSYSPLLKILDNKDSYYNYFENFTEMIIQDFVNADRMKSIDILSIDLVLLNYQKGNYEKSLSILQDSFDFFINNGWNFIGGTLLEIYLDCIKRNNINDSELILISNLKLLSILSNTRVKYGVNNYKLIKNNEKTIALFDSVKEIAGEIDNAIEFPLKEIFDIHVSSYIKKCESDNTDQYFIEISLQYCLGIELNFDTIAVELRHESGELVEFKNDKVKIFDSYETKMKLYTNDFSLGYFTFSKLSLCVSKNVNLIHNFEVKSGDSHEMDNTVIQHNKNSILHNSTVIHNDLIEDNSKSILCFPGHHSFWCEFLSPFSINLGSIEVLLRFHNKNTAKENIEVDIFSITDGVSINIEKSNFTLKKLDIDTEHDLIIPYSYFGNEEAITFKAKVSYTVNGEKYSHTIYNAVDTLLPISVSVQDIFKSSALFSKFQVGTSNSKLPIRVHSTELSTTNKNYSIITPKHSPSVLAFGEQMASFFYKINIANDYTIKKSDVLDLKISYSCLKDECFDFMKITLLEALKIENLSEYSFLFYNFLWKQLNFDYNSYAVYKVVIVTNKEDIETSAASMIHKHVEGKENVKKALTVIRSIINKQYNVDDAHYFDSRYLYISVPIPTLKHMQMIEFEYEKKNQYLVGEPIKMVLTIQNSTKWSLLSGSEENESNEDISVLAESSPQRKVVVDKKIELQFSLQNDENWLISGFKKQTFEITTDVRSEHRFEFMFIPLTVGNLLLPKVSIRQLSGNNFMDVDYKNDSETLLIVPEIDSITFSF